MSLTPGLRLPMSSPELLRFIVGVAGSAAIGFAGYRWRVLSASGALGAVVIGTLVLGCGGWSWAAALIFFFVSSSLLSLYARERKAAFSGGLARGVRRDIVQVMANGGLAAGIAVAYFFKPETLLFAFFVGVLASVIADTWATEVGMASGKTPVLVTSWRPVPVGTSGGVTLEGTVASGGGALVVAAVAYLGMTLEGGSSSGWKLWGLVPAGLVGGVVGAMVDSLLGATLQGQYHCASCQKITEKRVHGCGRRTDLLRGWAWLNNDVVNFLSSALGGGVAVGVSFLLGIL